MEELHSDENMKIIHLKLDRKDEHLVSVTEHLRHELFENENKWASQIQEILIHTINLQQRFFFHTNLQQRFFTPQIYNKLYYNKFYYTKFTTN